MKFTEVVERKSNESARVQKAFFAAQGDAVVSCSEAMARKFDAGGHLWVMGNGGSACDAQNFADELVGRFERDRPPLPAISLTVNTSDLTSIANDFGFDKVFSRQLEAHAKPGDVAIAISTSGNSANVLRAVESAKRMGLLVIALSGESGGKLKSTADICVRVPSKTVARIQEAHIAIIQIWCGLIEDAMFPDAPKAH